MSLKESLDFAEQDISYLKGSVDALSSLCALLIATHPRASKIVEVFKARASEVERPEHPTDALRAYADGFVRLAYELDVAQILDGFQRDELKLFQAPRSPHH